ncbi:MAG TPA: polysaccharide biosynthesis C-terminal domain-containing protein [Chitinophagaceae bacterium]|nr:polysaccharide biosynthesis C-terminal domain-containing protein [Chitinophagaceae bacterium]
MSGIKKLASETAVYGLSTVIGRFLNVFLTFWLTYEFGAEKFAVFTLAYAYVAFLNVIFTYGMETSYFRFAQNESFKNHVFHTAVLSIFFTTLIFSGAMMLYAPQIAAIWKVPEHPEYVTWFAWIIGFDTLSTIPFARLRQQGKPVKYALIKLANILLYVGAAYFFIDVCPALLKKDDNSFIRIIYNPAVDIGYTFIANLIASAATLLLLGKELAGLRLRFNFGLWKEMMAYSWPLLIVGLGGMINEVLNRIILDYRLPYSAEVNKTQVGILNANWKVAALVNIFIQVFRMGAEPFFFNEAGKKDAKKTYARVMKLFVIISCVVFLVVSLFADTIWGRYLVGVKNHPEYAAGIGTIPVVALAYVFLGIYYNLTVWYKLTNKTIYGAYITLSGAVITIVFNYVSIPYLGYWGSVWTTLLCYGFMMVVSYKQGQKHYHIPYPWKKLLAYICISISMYLLYYALAYFTDNLWLQAGFALLLLLGFLALLSKVEQKEFSRLPLIGRWYKTAAVTASTTTTADNIKI